MDGLNKVMLLGNLGADPELRTTSGGNAVLRMRLATTEHYKDKDNQRHERTEWHSVTVWGKRAEALSRFLSKGSRLLIEGRIQYSSYDDKEGVKRYRTDIVATEILLQDKKSDGGSREPERGDAHEPEGDSDTSFLD